MLQLVFSTGPPIPRVAVAGGHRRRRDLRRRHRDAARYRRSPCSMWPSCCWRWTSPDSKGILIVAGGCAALTVLSYVITHGHDPASGPVPALPDQPGGDRHHRRSCRAPSGHDRGAARACEPARPHARHDLRAQPRRRHHLLEPRGDRALRLAAGAGDRAQGRRAAADRVPRAVRRHHVRARRAADAGKANWCIPPATAGVSSWPAAGRCSATAAAVRRPSSRPTTTSPSARQVEDGLHRAQSELAHVARVATLGELTASIAHEVNQPLAAVVTNGEACLRWLGRAVPDIGQARSSVEHMIKNGQRASEVVRRLRALSRKSDPSYAAALRWSTS